MPLNVKIPKSQTYCGVAIKHFV